MEWDPRPQTQGSTHLRVGICNRAQRAGSGWRFLAIEEQDSALLHPSLICLTMAKSSHRSDHTPGEDIHSKPLLPIQRWMKLCCTLSPGVLEHSLEYSSTQVVLQCSNTRVLLLGVPKVVKAAKEVKVWSGKEDVHHGEPGHNARLRSNVYVLGCWGSPIDPTSSIIIPKTNGTFLGSHSLVWRTHNKKQESKGLKVQNLDLFMVLLPPNCVTEGKSL